MGMSDENPSLTRGLEHNRSKFGSLRPHLSEKSTQLPRMIDVVRSEAGYDNEFS
mgnify:FL=1